VVEKILLGMEARDLRAMVVRRAGRDGMVGTSRGMVHIFELIEKVAPLDCPVIIHGQSGTGKELVARAIHARSQTGDAEFLAINMAALPTELVEGQLFGHEKGAFTGAGRKRDGLLRSVHGGTVFLDEIGDLPMAAQAKLLRAIEAREVLPVGADHPVAVDFRLIAATNQSLEARVAEGHFRQDLYFRLNVFRIELPPLRARREDIPPLVTHFIARHARNLGYRPGGIRNEAMKLLLAYDWPGNVREMSNLIERATILAGGGPITPDHLPSELSGGHAVSLELREAVQAFERSHLAYVLRLAGGVRSRAATLLGIDPATLYRKLQKYGL